MIGLERKALRDFINIYVILVTVEGKFVSTNSVTVTQKHLASERPEVPKRATIVTRVECESEPEHATEITIGTAYAGESGCIRCSFLTFVSIIRMLVIARSRDMYPKPMVSYACAIPRRLSLLLQQDQQTKI